MFNLITILAITAIAILGSTGFIVLHYTLLFIGDFNKPCPKSESCAC